MPCLQLQTNFNTFKTQTQHHVDYWNLNWLYHSLTTELYTVHKVDETKVALVPGAAPEHIVGHSQEAAQLQAADGEMMS